MLTAITLDRQTGDGKYADVLDVAEFLGKRDHGSASNAIAVMVRESNLFAKAVKQLKEAGTPVASQKCVGL